MEVFEIVVALLLGGAILAAIARRIATPYPALVAIAGAALALLPNMPSLVLDPQLVLALFVAPVLLDAAFDTSQRDLRKNWRAVAGLAVGAVVLWLGVRDDGTVQREVQLARVETLRAALDAAGELGASEGSELLRRRYELRLRRAQNTEPDDDDTEHAEGARAVTAAERRRLIELRDDGTIGDTAFQQIEQELDMRELETMEIAHG
jgi:hypothetical protein